MADHHITTDHAVMRMQQRGIPSGMVPILLQYGTATHAGSGARRWFLKRREMKKLRRDLRDVLKHLDSLADTYLIENGHGVVMTVAHDID